MRDTKTRTTPYACGTTRRCVGFIVTNLSSSSTHSAILCARSRYPKRSNRSRSRVVARNRSRPVQRSSVTAATAIATDGNGHTNTSATMYAGRTTGDLRPSVRAIGFFGTRWRPNHTAGGAQKQGERQSTRRTHQRSVKICCKLTKSDRLDRAYRWRAPLRPQGSPPSGGAT